LRYAGSITTWAVLSGEPRAPGKAARLFKRGGTALPDTAKIIERGGGWAIEVEINGKAGYIGKAFDGVTIYPSFEDAQREAQKRGYLIVNAKGGDQAA
jgi:hypothetical protein